MAKIWEKILRNTMAVFGLFFIIFMFSLSVTSSWTFDYDFATENNGALLQTPTLEYPLGTDNYGRDLFSRIVFGAQISLIVGFFSTIIPAVIGGALGAFQAITVSPLIISSCEVSIFYMPFLEYC